MNLDLTQKILLECLSYDKGTGLFTWLDRPASHFNTKRGRSIFKAVYAGKQAGDLSREGYVVIGLFGKLYKAHRLAWMHVFGELPKDWIDHINRNRSDNRIENLRLATPKLNAENASMRSDNRSGVKGVSWHQKSKSWVAQISHHRKKIHIGCFQTVEAAADARLRVEEKLFTGAAA